MSRAERKSKRQDRRLRYAKWYVEHAGLAWSDIKELRQDAWQAGINAVEQSGLVDEDFMKDLRKIGTSFVTGRFLRGTWKYWQFVRDNRELLSFFGEAWNAVITGAPAPDGPAEAPRKQVDFGTVGSKLPAQTIGMMKPTADPEAWKAWVVPAIGLAAAFYLWRRS